MPAHPSRIRAPFSPRTTSQNLHRAPFASTSPFPFFLRPFLFFAILFCPVIFCLGCNASFKTGAASPAPVSTPAPAPAPSQDPLSISPATAAIQAWQTISFAIVGADNSAACAWSISGSSTSSPSILASLGDGQFQGQQIGSATVSVACGT
jgi:hypothetical protein